MGVAVKLVQLAVPFVVATSAVTGCGDSKSDGAAKGGAAQAGSAGSSSAAGSTATGGSSAGTNGNQAGMSGAGSGGSGDTNVGPLPLGESDADGCIMYAYAVCTRGEICAGSEPSSSCLRVTFACPDLTGSDGSTRTFAKLKECAAVFNARACDELQSPEFPSCVTPGTLAVGTPCSFASQCESLTCEYDYTTEATCGLCASVTAEGGDCSSPTAECTNGAACDGGVCRPVGGRSLPGLNAPCDQGRCAPDLNCASGTCVQAPAVDEPCAPPSVRCDSKSYCSASGTCQARPPAGMPCAVDAAEPNVGLCAAGARCEWSSETRSGTCLGPQQVGDPCIGSDPPHCYGKTRLRCDVTVTPPVCRALGKPGESCMSDSECEGSSVCECPGEGGTSCPAKLCRKVQFGGQSCADPSAMCHPAFTCEDGACKLRAGLQGTYARECQE